jgi:hypothetical protein
VAVCGSHGSILTHVSSPNEPQASPSNIVCISIQWGPNGGKQRPLYETLSRVDMPSARGVPKGLSGENGEAGAYGSRLRTTTCGVRVEEAQQVGDDDVLTEGHAVDGRGGQRHERHGERTNLTAQLPLPARACPDVAHVSRRRRPTLLLSSPRGTSAHGVCCWVVPYSARAGSVASSR